MDTLLIHGGTPLKGEVAVSGAKNAALPILSSCLLSAGTLELHNVPDVQDVRTIISLLERLGARIERQADRLWVSVTTLTDCGVPYELVKTMRASILLLGPLMARLGEARVAMPGGCAIGARPVDLHLKGLQQMGAEVRLEHGDVVVRARKLHGARIHLDVPTVTGTENLLMAATLAEGHTVIENAAREPEIVDLARWLLARGARIVGAGTDCITIEGVARLDGATYTVMPDRIEAGTYLVAGAVTRGEVAVRGCPPRYLEAVVQTLQETGVHLTALPDGIRLRGTPLIRPMALTTGPYPSFPTDMQSQFVVLACLAEGTSTITETVFERRFLHVGELKRMGAQITVEGQSASVRGVPRLQAAPVMASDLRASASLILAGLAAEGTTELSRVYHLDRGYERFDEKLSALGAQMRRVKSN